MRKNTQAYKALVESWRTTKFDKPPFIHKGDTILQAVESKSKICIYKNFEAYVKSKDFGLHEDHKLHLGLLPQPYFGDLANATIFILMLNPGLSSLSYFVHQYENKSKESISATTRQVKLNKKYPFRGLNPSRAWSSSYWQSKFDNIAHKVMKAKRISYREALGFLARHVAVLQLFPYRSPAFRLPKKIRTQLQSSSLIVDFVKKTLLPEARRGKVLIIVTRKTKSWGLHGGKNVIVYKGSESRAAHLSTKSRKAIVKHLGRLKA